MDSTQIPTSDGNEIETRTPDRAELEQLSNNIRTNIELIYQQLSTDQIDRQVAITLLKDAASAIVGLEEHATALHLLKDMQAAATQVLLKQREDLIVEVEACKWQFEEVFEYAAEIAADEIQVQIGTGELALGIEWQRRESTRLIADLNRIGRADLAEKVQKMLTALEVQAEVTENASKVFQEGRNVVYDAMIAQVNRGLGEGEDGEDTSAFDDVA